MAESITLAVDDTLLGDLVGLLDETARSVLVGVSVYRIPVDRIGVAWPVSQQLDPPPNPDRDARLQRINNMLAEAQQTDPRTSGADLGLSVAELDQLRADLKSLLVPPLIMVEGLDRALKVLGRLGLVSPASLGDIDNGQYGGAGWVVHRWTAATLARPGLTDPQTVRSAHAAAAAYWLWRVKVWSQSQDRAVEQLLEARFHHHAAGNLDAALELTDVACGQLRIWGAWGWEEQLYRETLTWLTPGSRGHAVALHWLGNIAQKRGNYDQALDYYRQSLTLAEGLGDRANAARSHAQIGTIAYRRGDYDEALGHYRRSLIIFEEFGDRVETARSYHELGNIAFRRGDYDEALGHYRQSLTIREELGGRAGASRSYAQIGTIAHKRGEQDSALGYYRRSLALFEELGDRAGTANVYHQLGNVAQERGDDEGALEYQ